LTPQPVIPVNLARYSVYLTLTKKQDVESILRFALYCGCERFSIFPLDSSRVPSFPAGAEERLQSFYIGLKILETDRKDGTRFSRSAHTWRFRDEAIPRILEFFPNGFSIESKTKLCLYLTEGYNSLYLLSNLNRTTETFMNITQIQMEALCNLGFAFEFDGAGISRRVFEKADLHIKAPSHISLNELDYDVDRYPRPNGYGWMGRAKNADNHPHILSWWTEQQDSLLKKWINADKWGWRPDYRKLISGVPQERIEDFKRNDPDCRIWVWYGVIAQFAYARAEALGLTSDFEPQWRTCIVCGHDFHESTVDVRWLPPEDPSMCQPCLKEWLFLPACEDMIREEILEYVSKLAVLLGRVPPARYEFSKDSRRFTPHERVQAGALNRRRPSPACVQRECGSWLQALIDSEVLSDGTRRTSRGTQCVANDGHVCLSLAEKTIDDYLHERGMTHTREVSYPDSPFRTDFVVNGVFIEYFGLSGDAAYDTRTREKICLCRERNIQLIEIYPPDLESNEALANKLRPVLKPDYPRKFIEQQT